MGLLPRLIPLKHNTHNTTDRIIRAGRSARFNISKQKIKKEHHCSAPRPTHFYSYEPDYLTPEYTSKLAVRTSNVTLTLDDCSKARVLHVVRLHYYRVFKSARWKQTISSKLLITRKTLANNAFIDQTHKHSTRITTKPLTLDFSSERQIRHTAPPTQPLPRVFLCRCGGVAVSRVSVASSSRCSESTTGSGSAGARGRRRL